MLWFPAERGPEASCSDRVRQHELVYYNGCSSVVKNKIYVFDRPSAMTDAGRMATRQKRGATAKSERLELDAGAVQTPAAEEQTLLLDTQIVRKQQESTNRGNGTECCACTWTAYVHAA